MSGGQALCYLCTLGRTLKENINHKFSHWILIIVLFLIMILYGERKTWTFADKLYNLMYKTVWQFSYSKMLLYWKGFLCSTALLPILGSNKNKLYVNNGIDQSPKEIILTLLIRLTSTEQFFLLLQILVSIIDNPSQKG